MSSAIEKGGDSLPTLVRFECYPDGRVHGSIKRRGDYWRDPDPDQGEVTAAAIMRLVKTGMSDCTPAEAVVIDGIIRDAGSRAAARKAKTEGAAE